MSGNVYVLTEPDGRLLFALATGQTAPGGDALELLDATGRRVYAMRAGPEHPGPVRHCRPFAGADELALLARVQADPAAVADELRADRESDLTPDAAPPAGIFEWPEDDPPPRPWWRRIAAALS